MTINQRAKKVKMLILDVDGVMTDGSIIYDDKGNQLKCFSVLDGMGFALLHQTDIKVSLITAKGSEAVKRRASEIGAVEVRQNAPDKLNHYTQILEKYNLTGEDTCFIGDDLVDLPVIKRAGLAVTVPNACSEVKESAHYITKKEGGKGAVREVIEIILRAQNKWRKLTAVYLCALLFVVVSVSGCARQENAEGPAEPVSREEAFNAEEDSEEPSEEMLSSFAVSGYEKGGKKQWDLEGESADISLEEINLKGVTGKLYGKEMNMTIVADEGSLDKVDNNVHLERNVKATGDDGATLVTDYLDWDAQGQTLSSDAPTRIKRGQMEAAGEGFIAQPVLKLVQLKKDVTVKMALQGDGVPDLQQHIPATMITCDGPLEVNYQDNLAVFRENVKVKDERGEIVADKMDVYFATDTEEGEAMQGMEGMGIEKLIATGDVEIHHGSNITYSQKAVYDTDTGKVTLTGQPKLVIYSMEGFSQLAGNKEAEEK
jgi:3-deoxy-D-manno-octulosonate 8-phosphate phosphatase (KDO 8-P phosphatase)